MSWRTLGKNSRNSSRAEDGHAFERLWRRRIFEKFKTWNSVTMRLGNGELLTSRNLDQKSRGMDMIVDIDAKSLAAGRRISNQVIKALKDAKHTK